MNNEAIRNALQEHLERDNHRESIHGEYHPSEVTGCPLKVVLNKMTQHETTLNCYLMQGTAVHHWLQESGVMDEALHEAGYHILDTRYEVNNHYEIASGVKITGTTDVLCEGEDGRTIFDIKYSSATPSKDKGRLTKYFSQTNTYAYMFGADEYGLIILDSTERDNLPRDGIQVLSGEPNEENWELVKQKCMAIHKTLSEAGYQDAVVWKPSELPSKSKSFWSDVMSHINTSDTPAYPKECKWCPHEDYCPVQNGQVSGGLASFKGGR